MTPVPKIRRGVATCRLSGDVGQIIDATIVAAPKQRNTDDERKAIKEGCVPEHWKEKPAKLAQKDRDARWTIKYTKAKPKEDGTPQVDLAVPAFGYKNHISIDRAYGRSANGRRRTPQRMMAHGWRKFSTAPIRRVMCGQRHSLLHAPCQRTEVESAQRDGAPFCASEADGPVRQNDWPGSGAVKIGLANLAYNMRRFVWLTKRRAPA